MRKSALTKDIAWAIIMYIERAGGAWPYGRWMPDGFEPDNWEYKTCCHDIAPIDMYAHCCTVKHIAALFNVDPTQLHQYFTEVPGDILWTRARATLQSDSSCSSLSAHQSSLLLEQASSHST